MKKEDTTVDKAHFFQKIAKEAKKYAKTLAQKEAESKSRTNEAKRMEKLYDNLFK